jgi:threonine dehydrogenase-like Zn-dependent dehydrogenase
MMKAGLLDPTPLVSRHMKLEEAPDAYEAYANREALKIVMSP